MRAMQIIEWGKPLEAREYPDPEPQGEEVLLRVEAAGVCHSDVHIWDGHFDLGDGKQISLESRGVQLPFTMGHEIAGEVAALGPRASGVKIGDKVSVGSAPHIDTKAGISATVQHHNSMVNRAPAQAPRVPLERARGGVY